MANSCTGCSAADCKDCDSLIKEIETPDNRVVFTREMKKDYTLLVPNMLPMHFKLFIEVFRKAGYKCELLLNETRKAIDCGVKYVHNDACYPCICVTGQFIDALQSGKYDVNKVAVVYMQTGGGCRASNYVSLMRKAFQRAGFPQVPIVTLNISGLEKHPGFKVTVPMYKDMAYGCLYGDLLMLLRNQCRVREVNPGETDEKVEKWLEVCRRQIWEGKLHYKLVKKTMADIVADFGSIERKEEEPVRVGIVGEIYVKFAPLGNNNLEEFLYREGAEAVVPGLLDFMFYFIYNNVIDYKLYGMRSSSQFIWNFIVKFMVKKKNEMNEIVKAGGVFRPATSFEGLMDLAEKHSTINFGMRMGEGWLLTAEMLELCEMGVSNIVCTQPFGCLPNHIAGKGMMKPIKEKYPDANIVAIDYDPGASRINQENRLKLMLSNARK